MLQKISYLKPGVIICLLIMLFGSYLRLALPHDIPLRTPDEAAYTFYSQVLVKHGVAGSRASVAKFANTEQFWLYPSPLRLGYLYLISGIMHLTDSNGPSNGVTISKLFSILNLLLLCLFGIDFFGKRVTAVALLLFSVSPMDLAITVHVWQDGVVLFFSTLCIYSVARIIFRPHHWVHYAVLLSAGLMLTLTKESGLTLYCIPVFLSMFYMIRHPETRKHFIPLALITVGICGLAFFIILWHAGSLEMLNEAWAARTSTLSEKGTPVSLRPYIWIHFAEDFFNTSPISFCLAGLGIVAAIYKRNALWIGLILCAAIYIGLIGLILEVSNLRLISPAYIPYYLLCGYGFYVLSNQAKKLSAALPIILIALLGMGAMGNYWNHQITYSIHNIGDILHPYIRELSIYRNGYHDCMDNPKCHVRVSKPPTT
ncbi:MAG: hypothetical protein ACI9Y8_001481 [Candidatus Omnitrophota bacterium]|jgi:hypothetical protein